MVLSADKHARMMNSLTITESVTDAQLMKLSQMEDVPASTIISETTALELANFHALPLNSDIKEDVLNAP